MNPTSRQPPRQGRARRRSTDALAGPVGLGAPCLPRWGRLTSVPIVSPLATLSSLLDRTKPVSIANSRSTSVGAAVRVRPAYYTLGQQSWHSGRVPLGTFVPELLRTPSRRSSQNTTSRHFDE